MNKYEWEVVRPEVGGSYRRCQCCRQEDVRIFFILYNPRLNIYREVGRECAKNLTGQIDLIEKLHRQIVSLLGKRERFCNLQSAITKYKDWWAIKAFNHNLAVSKTKGGSAIIKVDGEIIMDQTGKKPLYFNSMDEAKLYFFDCCASEILGVMMVRYKREKANPTFVNWGVGCENKI